MIEQLMRRKKIYEIKYPEATQLAKALYQVAIKREFIYNIFIKKWRYLNWLKKQTFQRI